MVIRAFFRQRSAVRYAAERIDLQIIIIAESERLRTFAIEQKYRKKSPLPLRENDNNFLKHLYVV